MPPDTPTILLHYTDLVACTVGQVLNAYSLMIAFLEFRGDCVFNYCICRV